MKHWQWVRVNFKTFKTEAVNQITLIPVSSIHEFINPIENPTWLRKSVSKLFLIYFLLWNEMYSQPKSENSKIFNIVLILTPAVSVVLRFEVG